MYEDEGFYFREDRTPPHYASASLQIIPWKMDQGAINWPALPPMDFSVGTVKDIVYARNSTTMIKVVHKRCLS